MVPLQSWAAGNDNKETAYLSFYRELTKRTAHLVAKWMCVGWCHGCDVLTSSFLHKQCAYLFVPLFRVLNTDNMSIVGVTIDYGPYGFIDAYDPQFICNNSGLPNTPSNNSTQPHWLIDKAIGLYFLFCADDGGRYAFDQQASVCRWNLYKLAEALSPFVNIERMKEILDETYEKEYERHFTEMMRRKV